ncbi:MAG: hypothetical protein EPO36_01390 [Chloroflexota bacterium]|nr:MAG: hypothetical protein EPO36_01390 [Chloroflexota bacterium]
MASPRAVGRLVRRPGRAGLRGGHPDPGRRRGGRPRGCPPEPRDRGRGRRGPGRRADTHRRRPFDRRLPADGRRPDPSSDRPRRGRLVSGPDLDELNAAAPAAASAILAPLFEGAPRFLGRLVAARPFDDWASLFDVARRIAHDMPEAEQVELIDAHPRLGAPPGSVSPLSFREQGYDRAGAAAAAAGDIDVGAELERRNADYEARFGFRYCVLVAGRSRAALLPGMAAALANDRSAELHRALDAVVDIAEARLEPIGRAG